MSSSEIKVGSTVRLLSAPKRTPASRRIVRPKVGSLGRVVFRLPNGYYTVEFTGAGWPMRLKSGEMEVVGHDDYGY